MENVHPDLIQIALDKTEGHSFELFAQDFLAVLEGRDFVPVGGVKDGGADGLYECGGRQLEARELEKEIKLIERELNVVKLS